MEVIKDESTGRWHVYDADGFAVGRVDTVKTTGKPDRYNAVFHGESYSIVLGSGHKDLAAALDELWTAYRADTRRTVSA